MTMREIPITGFGRTAQFLPHDLFVMAVVSAGRHDSPAAGSRSVKNRLPRRRSSASVAKESVDPGSRKMRQAFMSTQKGSVVYPEDMTLREDVEPGDLGACRRR